MVFDHKSNKCYKDSFNIIANYFLKYLFEVIFLRHIIKGSKEIMAPVYLSLAIYFHSKFIKYCYTNRSKVIPLDKALISLDLSVA